MKEQEDLFRPTALDQIVSELNHSGKSQYSGLLYQIPVRLQADLYAMVEVLTRRAGTSRNKIVNQLVEVGIEATLGALPEGVEQELLKLQGERMYQMHVTSEAEIIESGSI